MIDSRPLRSSTFRHLAVAYTINELGNWIGDVALAILVFDRTGSPLATAALFLALRFFPSLLAPLLTTRIQAISARRVLPALYATEATIFAVIALTTGHFLLPIVLVLVAFDGMIAIAAKALTRSATAASLHEAGLLREGNAILNLGFTTGGAVGPMLAGLIIAAAGAGAALWLDAASFAVAAVALATSAGLRVESDRTSGAVGRLRAGLREIRDQPGVLFLIVALAFAFLFSAVAVPVEVVFAKRTLHAGDSGYGLLLGSWGLGMIVGAAVFSAAARAPLGLLLGASAFAIAVGYGGLAVSPNLATACVFSAIGGLGNGAGWIAAMTAVQEAVSLQSQAAVMAVVESLNQVVPAFGFVLGGVLTAISSPRMAYLASAVGVGVVLLVAVLRPRARVVPNPAGEVR